jgi:lycopene cyclase domain-containing protein
MSAYMWVMLCSIAGPLLLSFDKKVAFYKNWKGVLLSVICISIPFLVWDEFYTLKGIWGFEPRYLMNMYIGHLPIEEVLFFIFIPYCCLFVHEVLNAYFSTLKKEILGKSFGFFIVLSGLVMSITHIITFDTYWYTFFACTLSSFLVIYFGFVHRAKWFNDFAFTFLVVLIPFTIVNGVLTGGITDQAIVWYSSEHIIGPRIWTIPIEDIHYNVAMLLPMVAVFEWWKSKKSVI